jgi:hypothetical protein
MNSARWCRSTFEYPSEDAVVAAEGRRDRAVAEAGVAECKLQYHARPMPMVQSFADRRQGCRSYGVAAWSAVLALGLLAPTASAHDAWADGSQIPVWVKSACCGKDEAHLLRPTQVHKVEGGYRIDGYPLIVPDTSALPSQDGNYWVFYQIYGIVDDKPQVSNVRCFFVPLGV